MMEHLRTVADFDMGECTCNDHDVIVNRGTPYETIELVRDIDMRCPIHGPNCPEDERIQE